MEAYLSPESPNPGWPVRQPQGLANRPTNGECAGKLAREVSSYFAVGSLFTPLSMNSIQNPWGSVTKNIRVVGAMKTGAFEGLVVCKLAALTRSIITSSSFDMNKKCAAPGS